MKLYPGNLPQAKLIHLTAVLAPVPVHPDSRLSGPKDSDTVLIRKVGESLDNMLRKLFVPSLNILELFP